MERISKRALGTLLGAACMLGGCAKPDREAVAEPQPTTQLDDRPRLFTIIYEAGFKDYDLGRHIIDDGVAARTYYRGFDDRFIRITLIPHSQAGTIEDLQISGDALCLYERKVTVSNQYRWSGQAYFSDSVTLANGTIEITKVPDYDE